MGLFKIEQSKLAYAADFALYAAAVPALGGLLLLYGPSAEWLSLAIWASAGVLGWTLVEYLLHRFVLHGLQPFRGWHAAHHDRPTALICAPTLLSAGLIVTLVFVPAWLLADLWRAGALTLGVLIGYLGYAVTHHATHHWNVDLAWLKGRRGRDSAFLYSSVQLVKNVANFDRDRAGAFLRKLRWISLALFIVALARPQLKEGEARISASGIDIPEYPPCCYRRNLRPHTARNAF